LHQTNEPSLTSEMHIMN